jgi:hypothetical protein
MKLPGFTVDSSLGASHEHYRINCPEHQPVGAIPQSSTLECYLECTRYCEQLQPFEEVERCLIGCKQVCEALPPDPGTYPSSGLAAVPKEHGRSGISLRKSSGEDAPAAAGRDAYAPQSSREATAAS